MFNVCKVAGERCRWAGGGAVWCVHSAAPGPEHAGVRSSMVCLAVQQEQSGHGGQEDHDRQDKLCRVHAWKLQAATAWPQR